MKVFVSVSNNGGVMFFSRRQSMDRELRKRVISLSKNGRLLMNEYSKEQFSENVSNLFVFEDFLDRAEEDDFCFVEGESLLKYKEKIDTVYLFSWNRDYPADKFLDINPSEFLTLKSTEDFCGYSHEKITLEVYSK